MKISIITAFPGSFSFLNESIPNRAVEKGVVEINLVNLLEFGLGEWRKIDDKPFGGGAGMVLNIEPIYRALKSIGIVPMKSERTEDDKVKIVITSAKGNKWTQANAKSYANEVEHLVIICGHYEGIDHRVIENFVDAEVSIGNYILSGGELAAMVMADSIVRLIPGAVGNENSIVDETQFNEDGSVIPEYPQYTRPETFTLEDGTELKIPEILLSGHHAEIDKWRKSMQNPKV